MATECDQQAVLCFIKARGGRVKSADLTDHFRATIPKDPALKQAAREAFKLHVDSVAYVKEENGEKYVCLKKKCRERPGVGSGARRSPGAEPRPAPPAAGDGTAAAGGAKSQPDISVMFSEGVNGRREPDMGNSSRTGVGLKTDRSTADKTPRAGSVCQEKAGKENRPARINSPRAGEQPASIPPQLAEAPESRSPVTRRGAALRLSVHLPGRGRDSPRGDSDYEAAAVTLEPLEHEWMMCASDGRWERLRRLLELEPGLLTRRDFVTGFTCLHWAAKLGNHELIVLLINFAKEHRVSVNVNARSAAGYTPLHLAAMHSHLEVVKLLVGAFDADVEARDYNGRKACQYLKSDIAQNILDIAGACVEADADSADAGDAGRWRLSRVLQSNFRAPRAQEDGDGPSRQRSLRRKSSFSRMKPSLNRIRLRSQIVHSASALDSFDADPTEASPKLQRPKSNLFG